ncbi:hypothetical protein B0T25DRAFT_181378 [Lasiosphaeria hispida]|uniref:F-box domain-containing protein n=1 Tax=Lasiosphaeria hispida TaxID=260671 RepID=A0AAJ0MDB8_9PEZI|nr:hypothetical protein B0T25DRAFT_181378 [Lasiosphaeria hispida]
MPLDTIQWIIRWILKLGPCLLGGWGQEVREDQEETEAQKLQLQKMYQKTLILQRLERTMDPLIAAQVYNRDCSPIYRLPTEVLLSVLDYCMVSGDPLAIECLCRVSRRFRLLIKHYHPKSNPFRFAMGGADRDTYLERRLEFTRRIQKDGLCATCTLHRKAPLGITDRVRLSLFRECEFGSGFGWGLRVRSKPHCDDCDAHHHPAAFAAPNQGNSKRRRQCLGRQGSVRLCDHVSIYWDVIERHITDWRQRRSPGSWQACLDDFLIECRDPSHDRHCTSSGNVPTWPRARLRRGCKDFQIYMERIILHLEWAPHSGADAFGLTRREKKAFAPDLRSLFQQYRRHGGAAASYSFPSCGRDPLPEMACFSPNLCSCVHYETAGETASTGSMDAAADSYTIFREWGSPWPPICHGRTGHSCWGGTYPMFGENTTKISMHVHPAGETGGSVCLVTTYEREIIVCHDTQQGKLNPSHWWLHAMDPATYPRPPHVYSLPLCWDKNCTNYRRKPAFSSCSGSDKINWPCIKGEDGC